ncbi:MAG: NAD(P)-dependent alcohol dehydrogenase [Acidobacteria bacterium]|nr:NAD(P)-dependent alcohol dehydrogenase [Acidobacteriota bacterium]
MKAYEIQNFGLENLALIDRPDPKPGPNQVLVKMHAWSLNYRDLLTATGRYNPRLKLPQIPLSDGAGEIVEVGAGVQGFKAGDRVANTFFERWVSGAETEEAARTALGAGRDGVLAEFVALHEDGVIPIPEHLTYAEAATLPCAALTTWNALVVEGKIKAGDTILTLGTGGVSIFALQFALLNGSQVIVTSSSDEKLAKARQLGAGHTINYKQIPAWSKQVRQLTGGRGVDHVVEVGGTGTFNQSIASLKRGGHISLIGVLAQGGEVNIMPVLMNNIRVQGIFVGSREMFSSMNAAIAFHRLRPVIDRTFGFEEAAEAFRLMESAKHFGKICISR